MAPQGRSCLYYHIKQDWGLGAAGALSICLAWKGEVRSQEEKKSIEITYSIPKEKHQVEGSVSG